MNCTVILSSTNFILPLELLIGFFPVNLAGPILKCIKSFFDVVENKMAEEEEPFFGFFQLLHLNNGVGQTGHKRGYFCLPEYHICQFSTRFL